jgi:hypothetical protein
VTGFIVCFAGHILLGNVPRGIFIDFHAGSPF